MKPTLTVQLLRDEAAAFAEVESLYDEPNLYGVTDGKAVGTYLEHKFNAHLEGSYNYPPGNSASGIDFPSLGVDIKVTSYRQPQSSCPFKDASQKIFGLGYHLLVFVYEKTDNHENRTGQLDIKHTIFVEESRTADYQTTRGLLEVLDRNGNKDDLIAFITERSLPVDDIGANDLADRVLASRPNEGYLTISNALQWRLQYSRVIENAGAIEGIIKVR